MSVIFGKMVVKVLLAVASLSGGTKSLLESADRATVHSPGHGSGGSCEK